MKQCNHCIGLPTDAQCADYEHFGQLSYCLFLALSSHDLACIQRCAHSLYHGHFELWKLSRIHVQLAGNFLKLFLIDCLLLHANTRQVLKSHQCDHEQQFATVLVCGSHLHAKGYLVLGLNTACDEELA